MLVTVTAQDKAGHTKTVQAPATVSTPAAFPDASNTGVPVGVTLTPMGGQSFSSGTHTIDAAQINGDVIVTGTAKVTITRSKILGHVDAGDDAPNSSLLLQDCEVDAGSFSSAAIGYNNVTVVRCNVHGGTNGFIMSGNCTARDSFFHGQSLAGKVDAHCNGIISNGNSDGPLTIGHCTVHGDVPDNSSGGGVSTNLSLFGDFSAVSHVSITNCLLPATPGGYSTSLGYNAGKPYGTHPTFITFTGNVFGRGANGKGGAFGTVTGWLVDPTNTYANNTWQDTGLPVASG